MTPTSIIIIFLLTWKYTLSICRSFQSRTCCSGWVWNEETSTCDKCPLGYHDLNCSEMCYFLSYGEDCQESCKCVESICDYRYDCRNSTGNTDYDTVAVGLSTTTSAIAEKTDSGISDFLMYIIIISLGMFFILCSMFVGTYFYKHCIKQTVISEQKGNCDQSNIREVNGGQTSAIPQQRNRQMNLNYLDPVNNYKSDYEEIVFHELDETFRL